MEMAAKKRFLVNTAYWSLIAAIAYASLKYLVGILTPFLFAFLIASVLQPPIRAMRDRLHVKQVFASVTVNSIFFCAITALIAFAGIRLVNRSFEAMLGFPGFYTDVIGPALDKFVIDIENYTGNLGFTSVQAWGDILPELVGSLGESVARLSDTAVGYMTGFAAKLPGFLLKTVVAVIAAYFISADYDSLSAAFYKRLPERYKSTASQIKDFCGKTLVRYVRSYAIILGITFLMLTAGLMILHVKSAIGIALAISALDILPVIGVGMVLLPWALVEFMLGESYLGAGLLVLFVVATIVRETVEPRIVGRQVGLHPLAALMSMFIGGSLFGVTGLLLLPVCVVVAQEVYRLRAHLPGKPS